MSHSDLNGTVGQFLLKSLKAIPEDRIIQINGVTDEAITARETLQLSCYVAAGLKNLGLVSGNDIVLIASKTSTDTIATFLGAYFQGLCVFPIAHSLKQLEYENILRKVTPNIIFAISETAVVLRKALGTIGAMNIPIYILDNKEEEIELNWPSFVDILTPVDLENFQCQTMPDPGKHAAVIISSSGTTGLPKGIALSHQCVLRQISIWGKVPFMKAGYPVLQVTSLSWISGYQLLLNSIAFGLERIYVAEMTPFGVLRAIQKYKPYWAFFSPAYLSKIMQYEDFSKFNLSNKMKALVGGTALPFSTVEEAREKWPTLTMYEGYGTTENGGFVTKRFCNGDKNSTGIPDDHVVIKVIDPKTGEELERNKEGEIICNSGESTMMGYWKDEKSTKNTIDENGFVHTGDVGYLNENNCLYITGRIKELVKVRGTQVSPQEIEELICSIPGVADVALVAIPHEIDMYHLRALVEKTANSTVSEKEIIDTVAEKLSEYKHLTDGVQFVEVIPRTVNGKIRRMSLEKLIK